MKMEKIQKEFQGSGRPDKDLVAVNVSFDSHSRDRVKSHFRSFERTWDKNSLSHTFEDIDLVKYVYTLFFLRCESQNTSLKAYSKVAKRVKIPSLIYLVLAQLGYVQIKEIGLTLIPSFKKDVKHDELIMSPEDMDKLSLELQELENLGHEMARGLPLDDGSAEFMMMEIIDGTLKTSDPKAHPVYAFLKSFVMTSSLDEFIKSRISWLTRDEYAIAYDTLVRSRDV